MKEMIIKENEAGQRLDKYLKKYLPEAPGSFLYKMLRKKNIVLNGSKASGSEKINVGDHIKLFLSDETIGRFSGKEQKNYVPSKRLPVIYENENILVLNKPSGMLSQRADDKELSVVEYVTGYLLSEGILDEAELRTFKPGVCNRLDRNTSGIIVAGKSLSGLQMMSKLFKERTLEKYYLCIVKGCLKEKDHIQGYLKKDEKKNKAEIKNEPEIWKIPSGKESDYSFIETEYIPIAYHPQMTLLKVHLITGRSHQIRAHLSSIGHPVLGDYKYGDRKWNDSYKKKYQVTSQLLHSYELILPREMGIQTLTAKVPDVFYRVIKETEWQHGIQEALGVLH